MMAGQRLRTSVLTGLVAISAIGVCGGDARAQMGFGFMPWAPVPSPTQFINDHALIRAGAGRREPARNVYSNNPNSYMNRLRDNGFSSHYSTQSGRSPGLEVDRRAAYHGGNRTESKIPEPPPLIEPEAEKRPVYALNTFFNAARALVWPNESPVTDDLKPKRDISDQACLLVLDLVEKHKSAPITTVTDARERLLEYGKPALRVVRSISTPRIAETFHLFLLSLYDSLAAAAEPPTS